MNSTRNSTRNSMRNSAFNKAPSTKMQMSNELFIYIVGILIVIGAAYYIWKQYTAWYAKFQETDKQKLEQAKMLECPDYWETIGKNKCKNVNNIGRCSIDPSNNVMDFNDEIFTNTQSGDYSKCKWAKQCNVIWGGIDKLC